MTASLINCTVLDGTKDMSPQENMSVIIVDSKIAAVEKGAVCNGKVIDLKGRFLMPGLINMHVHLPNSGDTKGVSKLLRRRRFQKICAENAATELLSGVTTLRCVGGIGKTDTKIRDKISSGKLPGPRMLVSDMGITVPGGHMAGSIAYPAYSERECRELVRRIASAKPDYIKLMVTGGVLDSTVKGEPGIQKMPPEFIAACCDEAHRLGLRVAAHAEGAEGIRCALSCGADTIEHGAELDGETVSIFKSSRAAYICTISAALPLARLDSNAVKASEVVRYNARAVFDSIISGAKTALSSGIPVGLGTDTSCPLVTHYDTWREIFYFHKYVGVTKKEALHTATLVNAQILGIDGITGSVEAGKCADLLVTDGNPLEDLSALRSPYMVAARGKIIMKPVIKKSEETQRLLDLELR